MPSCRFEEVYTFTMKNIVLLGDRNTGFLTHRELDATITLLPGDVQARWVGTDSKEAMYVDQADAVWVVPGGPYRNDAAVYRAIKMARTSGQPFLGTCSGFQYAVVEFARNVAGIVGADHAETAPGADNLVVDRLACSLIGEARHVTAVPGTRMHDLCGTTSFAGFHWCNYGIAPGWADRLATHGLVIAALADDAGVEAVELPNHPFFLATLFQPQVGALASGRLHPIIEAFVTAA
jgi:CTP synthase (UTP-ammonia lyase)